tara:strand:- start:2574 stop:3383 length:810 start_codon:yes stop_codon:yes gene_type:complete
MAIYNITSQQLEGKGILNSFEIPTAGGVTTTSSIRLLTYGQTNSVGPNPAYTDWLVTTGSTGTPGSVFEQFHTSQGMTNWGMQRVAQTGRGSITFGLQRGYGQLRLNNLPYAGISGNQVIPGTITAVDLTFRIGVVNSSTGNDRLGVFSAGTGSQLATSSLAGFPSYILAGNRTAYSDFITISSSMSPNPKEITFSLNSTAIAVMNNQNKNDGELINFAFIWEKDFTGTAPSGGDGLDIKLASGSNADPSTGAPADYFIPKFNITYIPD